MVGRLFCYGRDALVRRALHASSCAHYRLSYNVVYVALADVKARRVERSRTWHFAHDREPIIGRSATCRAPRACPRRRPTRGRLRHRYRPPSSRRQRRGGAPGRGGRVGAREAAKLAQPSRIGGALHAVRGRHRKFETLKKHLYIINPGPASGGLRVRLGADSDSDSLSRSPSPCPTRSPSPDMVCGSTSWKILRYRHPETTGNKSRECLGASC